MKMALVLFCLLFFQQVHGSERACWFQAVDHLEYIANSENFNLSDYSHKVSSGFFASEQTVIYQFSGGILDSWRIEMVAEDCFPIGITFIGDL